MYADVPCQRCGDNDGLVRYFYGSLTLPLCRSCYQEAETKDRITHHFVQENCPTCHQHVGSARFLKYVVGDKYKGKKVKQCSECHQWRTDVSNADDTICDDCITKVRFIMNKEEPVLCECGREMKKEIRHLPSGRVLQSYSCWYCNKQTEEVTVDKRKLEVPSGVPKTF